MECKLKRDSVAVQESVYDGCEEKPIDLTVSLPDYCPDIQKILKCMVKPFVTVKNIAGDRLEIEGYLRIKVLYLDAEGVSLHLCEKNTPFNSVVSLKRTLENPTVFAEAKTEYINCRAVSSRKLDIHGAFSVHTKVCDAQKYEFVSLIEEDGVEQRHKEMNVTKLVSSSYQQFILNEVLEIESGKLPAESIVYSHAAVILEDQKIASGKVVVKGSIRVNLLYLSHVEKTKPERAEYTIPFSEVLDCVGASENSILDIRLFMAEEQLQIRTDAAGENMLFEFEGRVAAEVTAFEESEIRMVTDAYSISYATELDKRSLKLNKIHTILRDSFTQKFDLDLNDGENVQLIDLWHENLGFRTEVSENRIFGKGKMTVCLLSADASGHPRYTEKMVDLDFQKEFHGIKNEVKCNAEYFVKEISGRISGNKLEVRVEWMAYLRLSQEIGTKCVFSVFVDESRKREKRYKDSLTIYYADKDESLWDIAEKYCTSAEAIRAENGIGGDFLSDGEMILIPS